MMLGMSGLLIVASIVGYLILGLGFARLDYLRAQRAGEKLNQSDSTVAIFLWGVLVPALAACWLAYGMHRLVTLPTKRERLEQRYARAQQDIFQLERDLGI